MTDDRGIALHDDHPVARGLWLPSSPGRKGPTFDGLTVTGQGAARRYGPPWIIPKSNIDPRRRRLALHGGAGASRRADVKRRWPRLVAAIFAGAVVMPTIAVADEGGVSFWLPGLYGTLSAVPAAAPGWLFTSFYYHTTVNAGADVATAREIEIGRFTPSVNVSLSANLHATADFLWINPSYAFATPVFGGQLQLGMGTMVGQANTSLAGTVMASIPPFTVTRTDSISNSTAGMGDLYPQATLKWNKGVDNFMIYGTGDIPVGDYSSTSLANLGIGHGAADAGAGYTYFNPQNGHEFSFVGGFTYNFMNNATSYQNGVDFHLDAGASQFFTKQWQLGVVGYVYNQVTGDSGAGDRVGSFESRVLGLGPEIGYLFPLGDKLQGYFNLKAYAEADARDRPFGYNVWLTLAIAPAAPTPPASTTPMYHK